MKTFYEFFAGGGMARAGLGEGWSCRFANDFDPMKGETYSANWGGNHLIVDDVRNISLASLPEEADLAWASFPCQDLSLAGNHVGIGHSDSDNPTRSGAFWAFWGKILGLAKEGRAPRIVVLENVLGILTSNKGKDFAAIGATLAKSGYRFGAVVVDASLFLPQSRPRVFIVAIRGDLITPKEIKAYEPSAPWHPITLVRAYEGMSEEAKHQWVWWSMSVPAVRAVTLDEIIQDKPTGVAWHTEEETGRLLKMMDKINLAKVEKAKQQEIRVVGTIYKRTRLDEEGVKRQRAEVRFDGTAGCLRTPSGGSSRQIIMVVKGNVVRTRLLSPREAGSLMGLPGNYILPEKYNDAYHVAGDGVVVPVVSHLRNQLFDQIIDANFTSLKTPLRSCGIS